MGIAVLLYKTQKEGYETASYHDLKKNPSKILKPPRLSHSPREEEYQSADKIDEGCDCKGYGYVECERRPVVLQYFLKVERIIQ